MEAEKRHVQLVHPAAWTHSHKTSVGFAERPAATLAKPRTHAEGPKRLGVLGAHRPVWPGLARLRAPVCARPVALAGSSCFSVSVSAAPLRVQTRPLWTRAHAMDPLNGIASGETISRHSHTPRSQGSRLQHMNLGEALNLAQSTCLLILLSVFCSQSFNFNKVPEHPFFNGSRL